MKKPQFPRKCCDCKDWFEASRKRPNAKECTPCYRIKKAEARREVLEAERERTDQENRLRTHYICCHRPPALAFEEEE